MIKLSKTSKLGTKSWSLQAFDTCPGSRNDDGTVVQACQGCYARTGMYRFGAVKAVRAANKEDWVRPEWVQDMVQALSKESHFRWFDSGDMYSIKLAEKIYQIMVSTPNTKHWLPTRMHKFTKFQPVIQKMMALPNVMVRPSSDNIDGSFTKGVHGSTIVPTVEGVGSDVFVCNAAKQGGKCLDCRACYNKSIPVIGYVQHGATMKKVFRLSRIQ